MTSALLWDVSGPIVPNHIPILVPVPTLNCILDAYVRAWPTYSQLHSGCLCTGLTYLQSTAFCMFMYRSDLPTVNCILDAYVRTWPTYSQLHSGFLYTGLNYLQSTAFWKLMYRPDLPTVNCILDAYVRAWHTYSQLHSGCLCTGLTYLQSKNEIPLFLFEFKASCSQYGPLG